MASFPPVVEHRLEGWTLAWTALELQPGAEEAMRALRAEVGRRARASHTL